MNCSIGLTLGERAVNEQDYDYRLKVLNNLMTLARSEIISGSVFKTYSFILSFSDQHTKKSKVCREAICFYLGTSNDTVDRHIKCLVKNKLISINKKDNGNQNTYTILDMPSKFYDSCTNNAVEYRKLQESRIEDYRY